MTDTTAPASGGLTSMFKKANHWRHTLMDISMLGMAIAGLVATGGATGFLDPVWAFLKMHVSGIIPLFQAAPGFLESAFHQAGHGVWFTGAQSAGHSAMHAGMSMGGMSAASAKTATAWGVDPTVHSELMSSHP